MITNGVLNWPNGPITFDPAKKGSSVTLSGGNLIASFTAALAMALCTVGKSSGKWYWEIEWTSGPNGLCVGIAQTQSNYNTNLGAPANGWSYTTFFTGSYKQNGGTAPAYGTPAVVGDIIGVALDMNLNQITIYRNNVSLGVMFTGLYGTVFPAVGSYLYPTVITARFAAGSFTCTPPAGFNALTP